MLQKGVQEGAGDLTPQVNGRCLPSGAGGRRTGRYRGAVPVRVVHLVAKTHLDLGFTALASEVEQQYVQDFFPRAISVAAQLRARGGAERLVWTTGSWILHRALHQDDADRADAVDAAVRAGDLAWHALPLTTHTELMDAPLFRTGLAISQELDERFGGSTTAAKMTDVPGHTRAMVPLLAEAGVAFLHLGVNPAWPVPDVPPVFRWRSPAGPPARPTPADFGVRPAAEPRFAHHVASGEGDPEVVVAYAAGGYGGGLVVPGCDEVLAFLHSGDNLGPPGADDVLAAHAELRARYPGADVRASTLDAFARALMTSGAVDDLPVVTSEIGDPWLFGAGSDPQKVAAHRALLRRAERLEHHAADPTTSAFVASELRAGAALMRASLLGVAEHTWGLDQKEVFPSEPGWDAAALDAIRSSPVGRRFEASWAEQWGYVADAVETDVQMTTLLWEQDGSPGRPVDRPDPAAIRSRYGVDPRGVRRAPSRSGSHEAVVPSIAPPRHLSQPPGSTSIAVPGAVAGDDRWEVAVDPADGAIVHLVDRRSGRVLADADHPVGRLTHQTFDEADYERLYAQLTPTPEDERWARRDNTKPGIDAAGARSAVVSPQLSGAWARTGPGGLEVSCSLGFGAGAPPGAPPEVEATWAFGNQIGCSVRWVDKPATRLPEATWLAFNPIVAEPDRWEIDKLGQRISPLDVVRRGGRSLHAVGEGMHYDGPDGRLTIATPDAPLVAPSRPNLLDADPPVPDLAGGSHVLLHDNCWGTNFPMWNEGPARFGFTISLT